MMALDSIAKAFNLTWSQNRTWKSDTTETTIRVETKQDVKEYHVTFLKPRKLMNISGSCVAAAGNSEYILQYIQSLILEYSKGFINSIKEFIRIS
jgi:peptidyl-tRNA hydrolase